MQEGGEATMPDPFSTEVSVLPKPASATKEQVPTKAKAPKR